jgi:hypothetical protein
LSSAASISRFSRDTAKGNVEFLNWFLSILMYVSAPSINFNYTEFQQMEELKSLKGIYSISHPNYIRSVAQWIPVLYWLSSLYLLQIDGNWIEISRNAKYHFGVVWMWTVGIVIVMINLSIRRRNYVTPFQQSSCNSTVRLGNSHFWNMAEWPYFQMHSQLVYLYIHNQDFLKGEVKMYVRNA